MCWVTAWPRYWLHRSGEVSPQACASVLMVVPSCVWRRSDHEYSLSLPLSTTLTPSTLTESHSTSSSTSMPHVPLRSHVSTTGVQVTPSPVKPDRHAHVKLPVVLVHVAFASQLSAFVAHSSM